MAFDLKAGKIGNMEASGICLLEGKNGAKWEKGE
jgi:hypothetical protein